MSQDDDPPFTAVPDLWGTDDTCPLYAQSRGVPRITYLSMPRLRRRADSRARIGCVSARGLCADRRRGHSSGAHGIKMLAGEGRARRGSMFDQYSHLGFRSFE